MEIEEQLAQEEERIAREQASAPASATAVATEEEEEQWEYNPSETKGETSTIVEPYMIAALPKIYLEKRERVQ